MAYFKDPNVERLYDIANKSNVKKQDKKAELIADFIDIMDNIVKDINIPSRRTFTFGDTSHLLNVALYKKNDWLYEVILAKYADKLSFNTQNHVAFSLHAAENLSKEIFVKYFKPQLDESDFNNYGRFSFYNKQEIQSLQSNKDYIHHLYKSSINNGDKDIYNFLNDNYQIKLTEKDRYLEAKSWFLNELAEMNDEDHHYNIHVKLNNITDIENISVVSALYFSNDDRKKTIALNTLKSTGGWSYKTAETIKNLKIIDKHIPDKSAINIIISRLFNSSESIVEKDYAFIIKILNRYFTNQEKIDFIFLEHSYNYQTKEKSVGIKDTKNIQWELYKAMIDDNPKIVNELQTILIPLLSYKNKPVHKSRIEYKLLTRLLNLHNELSLDSFGYNVSVIADYFNAFFQEGLHHMKQAHNRPFNTYLESYMDFFITFLNEKNLIDMTQKFKAQAEINYKKTYDFLDNMFFYQHFYSLSPWILLSFIPEKSKQILNTHKCQEEILEQLIFLKTFSASFPANHYKFTEKEKNNFLTHIDKCIDLIYEQAENISLSREELATVIHIIPENVDVKEDTFLNVINVSSSIKQRIALCKQIVSNVNVQKKRL